MKRCNYNKKKNKKNKTHTKTTKKTHRKITTLSKQYHNLTRKSLKHAKTLSTTHIYTIGYCPGLL